tara:strand:+ start:3994 stop:4698 length:705 start_codon:yes stop_codon:yes gene_type:complete
MKKLKYLLSISLVMCAFVFTAEDEEVRTMEKDGVIYKINNSSLHITPTDNAILKASDDMDGASKLAVKEESKDENLSLEDSCSCPITVSFGTITALGDEGDAYDPGTSLSIKVASPWAFDLFDKNWKVSGELNLSNLSKISNGDDLNINAGIAHFDPSFDLPVNIDFGLGIAHIDGLGGISGIGSLDVNYPLPFEAANLSLGFRYQKYVNVSKNDPYLDFGLLDTYNFNISFTK